MSVSRPTMIWFHHDRPLCFSARVGPRTLPADDRCLLHPRRTRTPPRSTSRARGDTPRKKPAQGAKPHAPDDVVTSARPWDAPPPHCPPSDEPEHGKAV